jgi:hypothetical protein
MSGLALACAAERFLGASFRLHGRDPLTGSIASAWCS